MNTATTQTLSFKAAKAIETHGQSATTRTWSWVEGDTVVILSHVKPVYRSAGPATWAATVTVWPETTENPTHEAFSPRVSTRARALEWLARDQGVTVTA
jgi:hypothetical protein